MKENKYKQRIKYCQIIVSKLSVGKQVTSYHSYMIQFFQLNREILNASYTLFPMHVEIRSLQLNFLIDQFSYKVW